MYDVYLLMSDKNDVNLVTQLLIINFFVHLKVKIFSRNNDSSFGN